MKHIVIDLEMNGIKQKSEARHIVTTETIEIGAVMLDEKYQEISSFRTYVKPEYNDKIDSVVKELTGITYEMVENAPSFENALRMFTSWCLEVGDDVCIYAWSTNDYIQISKEMILKEYPMSSSEERILTTKWSDFQHEFDFRLGFDRNVALKAALEMAGLDFVGRAHDALDDARNTAELLQIFRDEKRYKVTLSKVKEAMKPKPMTYSLGELIDFSAFAFA